MDEPGFDSARAELFEAVGHPYRIKIIHALGERELGFAELKKKVGLESSGHLAFHLGKLEHLVAVNSEGSYALTGEGREALEMIQSVRERDLDASPHRRMPGWRDAAVVLLVLLFAVSALALMQQMQLSGNTRQPGTVILDGKSFWYVVIPLSEIHQDRNISLIFNGVSFTLVPTSLNGSAIEVTLTNASIIHFPASGGGQNSTVVTWVPAIPFTVVFYPNVEVKFPDGATETMSVTNTTKTGNVAIVSYSPPSFPWFSVHQNPQAAVSVNSTSLILYVSAER